MYQFIAIDEQMLASDFDLVTCNGHNPPNNPACPCRQRVAIHNQIAALGNAILRQQFSCEDSVSANDVRTHAVRWNCKSFVDKSSGSNGPAA